MAVDVARIRRAAGRYVRDPDLRDDVVQRACLYGLTRPTAMARQLVIDAIRVECGRKEATRGFRAPQQLDQPDWIPSLYATDAELWDRWLDEQSEDQADEWRRLTADERDRRVAEGMRGLGTSL